MNIQFEKTSGPILWGKQPGRSLHGKHDAPANSYRLPSQSILHRQDVPNSPLEIGALFFVVGFVGAIVGFLWLALFLVGLVGF